MVPDRRFDEVEWADVRRGASVFITVSEADEGLVSVSFQDTEETTDPVIGNLDDSGRLIDVFVLRILQKGGEHGQS